MNDTTPTSEYHIQVYVEEIGLAITVPIETKEKFDIAMEAILDGMNNSDAIEIGGAIIPCQRIIYINSFQGKLH